MKLRVLGILSLLLLLAPTVAQAIETYGSFAVSSEAPTLALFSGDITPKTPLDFRRLISAHPDVEVVALWSKGGEVHPALLLADDMHQRQMSTIIPKGAECYSACAFLFLSGHNRRAEGELGVHQFYGGEDTASSAQNAVSDIVEILGKFDVPPAMLAQMLRTPPEEMHVFSDEQIVEFGINRGPELLDSALHEWGEAAPTFESIIAAHEASDASSSTDAMSGPSVSFALYRGVDFYGSDVAQFRAADIAQCYIACLEHDQCMAMTMNIDPRVASGPNCFLKSDTGDTEFYDMAISGRFQLSDEPTHLWIRGRMVPADDVMVLD
ncbi:PAN domain-containing protein [Pelagibacterium montanilacus]|uniref:PAN domain-containing protein n=1 Tax=Pelagibacterium montanilacus TaxID=2185280 RepID=UPI000F8D51C0|nr:PAN domain-containing protein [Pelagibacterium montanilacus]